MHGLLGYLCQQKMKHTFDIQPIKAWDSDLLSRTTWIESMLSQGSENTAGRVDERGPSVDGTKRNVPAKSRDRVKQGKKNMFVRLKWLEGMEMDRTLFVYFGPFTKNLPFGICAIYFDLKAKP